MFIKCDLRGGWVYKVIMSKLMQSLLILTLFCNSRNLDALAGVLKPNCCSFENIHLPLNIFPMEQANESDVDEQRNLSRMEISEDINSSDNLKVFIYTCLKDLLFPYKENLDEEERAFLNTEAQKWVELGFTEDEIQYKFLIRRALLPKIEKLLLGYIPDEEWMRKEQLDVISFMPLLDIVKLYNELEKWASRINGGTGVFPLSKSLNEFIRDINWNIPSFYFYEDTWQFNYDLSTGMNFNAVWFMIQSQNMNNFDKIVFDVKSPIGLSSFPDFRIEFDDLQGRKVSVPVKDYFSSIKTDNGWQTIEVNLSDIIKDHIQEIDWNNVGVFSVVFWKEDLITNNAPLKGVVLIRNISFNSKDIGGGKQALDEVLDELDFLLHNKNFLKGVSYEDIYIGRPLFWDIDEDRKILTSFSKLVKEKMAQGMPLPQAQQMAWDEFKDTLANYNNKESLVPFLSKYIHQNLDFKRPDHKGFWDWYIGQIDSGKAIAQLKREIAISIIMKPYVERMLGDSLSPYGINRESLHSDFIFQERAFKFLENTYSNKDFLKEILYPVVELFVNNRQQNGLRDEITGLVFDSKNGRDTGIAATGFGLTALAMAVKNGFISYEEGIEKARKTLETIYKIQNELVEYEQFLEDTLKRDVEKLAHQRGVEILGYDIKGKIPTERELNLLHARLTLEEELRKEREPELLYKYLEIKGKLDAKAQELYVNDPYEFVKQYSPIFRYGRYGLLYRYFASTDDIEKIRQNYAPGNDASTIDNAILGYGILTIREAFKDKEDIREMADAILSNFKWSYYLNPDGKHPYSLCMGWLPEYDYLHNFKQGFLPSNNYWDRYTDETLLIVLLAVSSPTYPIAPEAFYSFYAPRKHYKDRIDLEFIPSWHNGLFSFHVGDIWLDKRDRLDREGRNWYGNSINAALTNRLYVIDNQDKYLTWDNNSWPITTMLTPFVGSYVMHYGFPPTGGQILINAPIVAPNGFAGSLVHTIYSLFGLRSLVSKISIIWGSDGFRDSYSLDIRDGQLPWVAKDTVGYSEGIFLSLFNLLGELDNYEIKSPSEYLGPFSETYQALLNKIGFSMSQKSDRCSYVSIWDLVMSSDYMKRALAKVGWTQTRRDEARELSGELDEEFQAAVDGFVQKLVETEDFGGIYDNYQKLLDTAVSNADYEYLAKKIIATINLDKDVDCEETLIRRYLLAETFMAQLKNLAYVATGLVYKDGRNFDAIEEYLMKSDYMLSGIKILLHNFFNSENVSSKLIAAAYALLVTAYKNNSEYFLQKEAFRELKTYIKQLPSDIQENIATLAAEIIYKYDFMEGELSDGGLNIERIKSDILGDMDISHCATVSYSTIEKDLDNDFVFLNPLISADSGIINYFANRVIRERESLEKVIRELMLTVKGGDNR